MTDKLPQPLPASAMPAEVGPASAVGSQDGTGAGDYDTPFGGFRAYQFGTRQLARFLLLRVEVLEAKLGRGQLAPDLTRRGQTFSVNGGPERTRPPSAVTWAATGAPNYPRTHFTAQFLYAASRLHFKEEPCST
jgi:hypothetical protein